MEVTNKELAADLFQALLLSNGADIDIADPDLYGYEERNLFRHAEINHDRN